MSERKRTYIAASVSEGMHKAIEDYRWENRMTVAQIVTEAVKAYLGVDNDGQPVLVKGSK